MRIIEIINKKEIVNMSFGLIGTALRLGNEALKLLIIKTVKGVEGVNKKRKKKKKNI